MPRATWSKNQNEARKLEIETFTWKQNLFTLKSYPNTDPENISGFDEQNHFAPQPADSHNIYANFDPPCLQTPIVCSKSPNTSTSATKDAVNYTGA